MKRKPTFKLVGANVAVDFVNTIYPPPDGSIRTYADLRTFAHETGILDDSVVRKRLPVKRADQVLQQAIELRGHIHNLFTALQRKHVPPEVVTVLNQALKLYQGHPELVRSGRDWVVRERWIYRPGKENFVLMDIAMCAALIVSELPRVNVRRCADPNCIRFFYDDSPSHRRRWCDMSGCGNRAKVAAFARRKR